MSNFHQSNRNKLKKLTKSSLIIIPGNVLIQKSLDQPYPFKQDNNFWYLTGVDEPSLVLVMDGNNEFLIVPTLSTAKTTFDGALDLKGISKVSAIRQIYDEREGWAKVKLLLNDAKSVAMISPRPGYLKRFGIYPNPVRANAASKVKRLNSKVKIEDVLPSLARLRMVKQPIELAAIKKAIKITSETLIEALDPASINSVKTAKQLEAIIGFGFVSRGASSHSFDPILAQGKKATTIHYIKNDQELNSKDLLLIDVGCEVDHYCSDISRTISLSKPTPRQQSVFNAVFEVQQSVIKEVKAGITFKDLELKTEELIGRQLIKLGLIQKADRKEIRRYYPHSVSHSTFMT
jgi:Xaa-Pro aminopeptidase